MARAARLRAPRHRRATRRRCRGRIRKHRVTRQRLVKLEIAVGPGHARACPFSMIQRFPKRDLPLIMRRMRNFIFPLIGLVAFSTVSLSQLRETSVPLGAALDKAMEKSVLTGPRARPFHIKVRLFEPTNPECGYCADRSGER